jgi:hypothetical protein
MTAPHNPRDAALGRQVRATIWRAAARTSTVGAARDQVIAATVYNHHPRAKGQFPEWMLAAVTRQLEAGACTWCAAALLAAANGEPPPRPTPANYGLLGSACGRCRIRFRAALVARRESAHGRALTAAGFRPEAVGRLRTPEQVAEYTAHLQALTNAKLPPFYGSRRIQPRR